MNRAELQNIPGFHAGSLLAAAAHLRSIMPRKPDGLDATALIRNEGHMNGYLRAIEDLVAAATPQPPKSEKRDFQPYSAPQPQNENPNRT